MSESINPSTADGDDGESRSDAGGVSRRGLLARSGAVGLGAAGVALLPGVVTGAQAAPAQETGRTPATGSPALSAFDPLRPPAVPLAVRSPYLSTWMAADQPAGHWPTFWT